MPTLGAFQSVFQLAAALNIGVSGILTLWENPAVREGKRIGRLRDKADKLVSRFSLTAGEDFDAVQRLSSDCLGALDRLDKSDPTAKTFSAEKVIALSAAIISLLSLLYVSEYPDDPITPLTRGLGYFLLFVTPALVAFLTYRIWKMSGKLGALRAELDKRYVALVNRLSPQ